VPGQRQQSYHRPPQPLKFECRGIQLSRPPNNLSEGKYSLLLNVRSLQDGTLQMRAGLNNYLASVLAQMNVHSMRLLVDSNPAASNPAMFIVGSGVQLYGNATPGSQPYTLTPLSSGFSGSPLSLVAAQPPDSPDSWMYVADSNQMVKVRSDGTVQNVGIAPPAAPPYAEINNSNWIPVDELSATTGWTAGGTAGSPSTSSKVTASTTVAFIEYDSADNALTLGSMATVAPTNSSGIFSWLNLYCHLVLGGSQTVAVTEVYPGMDATTVAGVSYDAGTTGMCTVVFTIPVEHADLEVAGSTGVARNSVVLINGVYYRVLSVTPAPDGSYSMRLNSGTHTIVAGNTAQPVTSFRAQIASGISAGATVTSTNLNSTVSTGTGTLTKTSALDLSVINGRALQEDDFIHISVAVSNPAAVIGGYVALDVDSTTNDFQHNAYYYSFQVSPLEQSVAGNLTAIATLSLASLQGGAIQTPLSGVAPGNNFTVGQLGLGNSQWCTVRFKISQMTRVGTDRTRSLANVAALQISLTVTDSTVLEVVSWGIDGTWLPEVTDGDINGFVYRFRYRSLATGAKSIPSPATRFQLRPSREEVLLIGAASSDPQVDVLDWERFGGANGTWDYFATSANTNAASVAVYDNQSASGISDNGANETDVYQPFPVQDLPASGTVNAVGSSVAWVSGPKFKLGWAPGTLITIAQQTYTVYRVRSTTLIEIVESVSGGVLTGVAFSIPSPTLLAQPLAKLWGPLAGTTAQFNFGCADPLNPGRLYFTKGNNPDAAPDTSFIDVTNATEPLVNGFLWDQQSFVFTSARLFALQPSLQGPNLFIPRETPVGKGLLLDWCFTVGPLVWFRAKDGLYETDTIGARSITDEDLYPLFPHGEEPAQPVTVRGIIFYPPNDSVKTQHRLEYHNGFVVYDYLNTNGQQQTLFYRVIDRSWWPDRYADGTTFNAHYSVEGDDTDVLVGGTTGGMVTRHQGSSDNGAAIVPRVVTPAIDGGDTRSVHQFGDVAVDFQPTAPGTLSPSITAVSITVTPVFDSLLSPGPSQVLTTAPLIISEGLELPILDLASGTGLFGRDIALDITWADPVIELWEWMPTWLIKPELTILRFTDWDDMGYPGAKFLQGFKLRANTFNQSIPLVLQYYDETLKLQSIVIPIQHPDEVLVPYTLPGGPVVVHLARVGQSGESAWIYIAVEDWVWEPMPELASSWITQPTTHDLDGWQHIRDGFLPIMAASPVTLLIIDDTGAPLGGGITIPASGGPAVFAKQYWVPVANKSRAYQYSATSAAGFRVFQKDLEVRVKAWGSTGPYRLMRPFGDASRESGARI
jgi:hypothetical protein